TNQYDSAAARTTATAITASSIHGVRRAGFARPAALGGAIVEGVVDMMMVCVYALNIGQSERENHATPYLIIKPWSYRTARAAAMPRVERRNGARSRPAPRASKRARP